MDLQRSIDRPTTDNLRINRYKADETLNTTHSAALNLTIPGIESYLAILRALPSIIAKSIGEVTILEYGKALVNGGISNYYLIQLEAQHTLLSHSHQLLPSNSAV